MCGSVARVAPQVKPKKSGSLDPTLDSVDSREVAEEDVSIATKVGSLPNQLTIGDVAHDETHFQPPSLVGFQVITELGRGGMGVVYRARDLARGRDVALKTLQRLSPDGLHRFKQEFRSLADIAHPNLAPLYELLSDGQTWCFTMELLEGVDFLEYVWSEYEGLDPNRRHNPLAQFADNPRLCPERIKRLEEAIQQLALGLNALHEAGMLHSDIKPSNVFVTKEGRLLLLDFGLVSEMHRFGSTQRQVIQGTPIYMSPEQAAGGYLTPASDWYSVGVMLYEALTGQLPFSGSTTRILSRKQLEVPLQPTHLASDTPQHLNDLCTALLDRDPANRPSVNDVLRCVGGAELIETKIAAPQSEAAGSFQLVGRQRHLEQLRESFDQVSAGNTRSIFVHGKSGMGKSVLVRSFLNEIKQSQQAVVLEGRCYEQESVPFKALDSLIDSLALYLKTLPTDVVRTVMPRDRRALTRVFPVLGAIPEIEGATYPSIENADQQELRQRAMNALRELLQRLAIGEPLVLYVDDLQWGDVDSAGLLADLVRPPDAPRILLLASYRSEDVGSSACLRAVNEAYTTSQNPPHRAELSVAELSDDESTELALMLLGRDDEANHPFAKKIAQESGGWPFFVWELAQHVQEDPAIADQRLDLDEVIWARVNRLGDEISRMLQLIAVTGRPIPAAEVYQAMQAHSKGPSLMARLRTGHLVRMTESESGDMLVETYHDRIRESVIAHLDHPMIKDHNLRLAETIEQVSGIRSDDVQAHISSTPAYEESIATYSLQHRQWQRVFDMAFFFDAAGEHARAFPYSLLAAEQSRQQNAFEVAEQQFRIAQRGTAHVSSALRFRVHEGLGDVLVLRGRYDDAIEQYEAARLLVDGNRLLARIDFKLGVASFKKGDMGDSRDYFEKAVKALDERPPSALSVVPRAIKEALVQVLHTRFPSRFLGNQDPNSAAGQLDLFRARVFDQMTISYWFSRGMNFVLWSHLRQMNLAERYPPSQELGKTYAFHAVTMTGIPMANRGITYAKKAYEISVKNGDLWGQGKARSYHTFACIVLARFKEGVAMGTEAVDLLEQAGDVWESNMARMIATVPMYHLGDLKSAYRGSRKTYEIGMDTGDYSAVCISLLFWIPNAPKTIPAGAIQRELQRPREDPLTITAAVYARGLELLFCEDQPREAASVLQESLSRAKQLGLRNVCLFSAATWKATALRIAAEREPDGSARRRAIRDALKAARSALRITKRYLACRPHALRERGLIAALAAKHDQARRYFDESLQVAEAYEARYDRAKTLLARGELGLKMGWPDAEAEAQRARAVIEELENVYQE